MKKMVMPSSTKSSVEYTIIVSKKIVVKNGVNVFKCFVIFGTILGRKFRWYYAG